MILPTSLALLLVGQLVSALPFEQIIQNLPQDVVHIAHDEANRQYLAYMPDGTLYGRYPAHPTQVFDERKRGEAARASGPCARLAIEEAQQLPGYKLIEEYANQHWGTGKRKVVTNPTKPDQVRNVATACVGSEIVQVKLSGQPNCNTRTGKVEGKTSGANGTITTSVASTYSNAGSWSVRSASTIGTSATVSATFKIPEILEVGPEITTSAEFTSEAAHSFSTKNSETTTHTSMFNIPDGKNCEISYETKTCTIQGRGRVRYEAGGWIWFEYNKKVKDHWKWAVSIEGTIKNVDDRSSFMEFSGNIVGSSKANFDMQCEPI